MLERLSQRENDLFNSIAEEVARSVSDPEAASASLAKLQGQLVRMRRVLASAHPTKLYAVGGLGSVIVANTGITAGARVPFNFPQPGRIVGVKGMVREGMTLLSHVTVSILDAEGRPVITNGTAEAFASLALLQGNAYDQGGYFPFLFRRVASNEQWTVQCSSGDALPGAGSTTYTPEFAFYVEVDRDSDDVNR